MVKKLNLLRIEDRGEELKVPHHASAAVVHDGKLPYIKATCLTLRQLAFIPNSNNARADVLS